MRTNINICDERLYRCLKVKFEHEQNQPLKPIDFKTYCIMEDKTHVDIHIERKPKYRWITFKCDKKSKKTSLFQLLNNLIFLLAIVDGYSLQMSELKCQESGSSDPVDLFAEYMDAYGQIDLFRAKYFDNINYDALTPQVLIKWNELLNKRLFFVEMLKTLFCKTGLTNDIVLALLVDITNWICSIDPKAFHIDAQKINTRKNNCNDKKEEIKSLIEYFDFDKSVFLEEYKHNDDSIFTRIINTRNAIMHASYKKGKDCLNKNEILFYRLKFTLMYTLIAFNYLGIDYYENDQELKNNISYLDDNIRKLSKSETSKTDDKCNMINVRYYDKAYSGPEFCKVITLEKRGIQFFISLEERKKKSGYIRILNINTNEDVEKSEIDNMLFTIEKYLMLCEGYFLPIESVSYLSSTLSNKELQELGERFLKVRLKYYKTSDCFCNSEYNLIDLQKAFNKNYIEKWQKGFEFASDGKSLNIVFQLYFYMMSSSKFDIKVRLFYMVVIGESLVNLFIKNRNKSIKEKIEYLIENYGTHIFDDLEVDKSAEECAKFRNQITHYNPKKSISITEAEAFNYIKRFSLLYRIAILDNFGITFESDDHLLDAIKYIKIQ